MSSSAASWSRARSRSLGGDRSSAAGEGCGWNNGGGVGVCASYDARGNRWVTGNRSTGDWNEGIDGSR